jgi:transposase-like protein
MAGRKPLGPALVEHLDGSTSAKERLELILATIAGKVTVVSAAEQLGISEAMFYKLRSRVLQVSLEDLEPKPIGRPAQTPSEEELQQAALAARVAELERELAAQAIRLELAQTFPHLLKSAQPTAVKKTKRPLSTQQKRRQRQARQRRP